MAVSIDDQRAQERLGEAPFASGQARAAKRHGCDGDHRILGTERRIGGGEPRTERNPGDRGEQASQAIGDNLHKRRIHSGREGGRLVAADHEKRLVVWDCAQSGPYDDGRRHEQEGARDRPDPRFKPHRPVGRRTRGDRQELDVETGEDEVHADGRHHGLDARHGDNQAVDDFNPGANRQTRHGRHHGPLKPGRQQRRNDKNVHEPQQRPDGDVDSASQDGGRARHGGERERREQGEVAVEVLRRGEQRLDEDVHNDQEEGQAGRQGPGPLERAHPSHDLCTRPKKLAIRRCRSSSSRPNSVKSVPSLNTSVFLLSESGQFRTARVPLLDEAVSYTMSGRAAVARALSDSVSEPGVGSLLLFHYPSSWNHVLGDHAVSFQVLPLGPMQTELRTKWLVHKEAIEGKNYTIEELTHVWLATNDQDRRVVQENQIGVCSPVYEPGPYAPEQEDGVRQFVDWCCRTMQRGLGLAQASISRVA